MYSNIQSIQSKLYELNVQAVDLNPDIILLTETWCNQSVSDATLTIPNYHLETELRRDREDTTNGVGGGLLVYAKTGLRILPSDKFKNNEFKQFCNFTVQTKGDPLHIVLVYRPPGAGHNNTEQLCNILHSAGKNTVLIGDVNLPDINWLDGTASSRGRRLLETVTEENMEQLVHFPTHVKGNTLDLVITNCSEKIISVVDEGRIGKSDHCTLLVEMEINVIRKKQGAKKPNWNKADIPGLKNYLRNIDWESKFLDTDVEDSWTTFKNILDLAVQKFVPCSTIRAAGQPKWLTREIIRLVRRKKRAWQLTRTHGTAENWNKYKSLEREVIVKLRNAKRNMEKRLANMGETTTKTFANYIKSKTKSKTGIGPLKDENGELITDEREMAEKLNNFFANVFTVKDASNIPVRGRETEASLNSVLFTEDKIRNKIKNLKKNSAPGPDGINVNLLQNAREELLRPLLHIYQKSLDTGTVPLIWKQATVTPIFKKGTKGDAGNYRPVSLTSIPCKIFESIVKDEIMSYLIENKLIKDSQHGFMPGRSCTTNLITFLDRLTDIVDKGKSADVFYLDFAKAFDKVPKNRLLQKMATKGIGGQILQWVEGWLTGRKQVVRVGDKTSTERGVESGVPQGSVLGPPLFTIFIDDVDDYAPLIDMLVKFADDTKGLQEISSPEDREKLQNTLDSLGKWAEDWGMQFNVAKCKIMHVGRNNPGYDYYMSGTKLNTVEEEKDIGVTVHASLKPSKHCKKVAATASAVLRQLAKNFHYRDRHIFKKLYVQYVRPHVEFASPAWSPWTAADKEIIENVQKKAVGMISGLSGKTYEEKCQEIGLDTLETRRTRQDLLQAYKIFCGKDRIRHDSLFTTTGTNSTRQTRFTVDPLNIVEKRSRLDVRKNSYAVRVADNWNKLSHEVKTSRSVPVFKNAIMPTVCTGRQVDGHRR